MGRGILGDYKSWVSCPRQKREKRHSATIFLVI